MNYPLVSVVVPVYNMENFLAETLDSVLKSNYPNFEVVMVDDGSTDSSAKIAANYAATDKRIRILSQANGGASKARNTAIANALGEYILPVDADNLISDDYISRCVEVLTLRPEVKIVSCEAEFFGGKTGRWKFPPFSLKLLARKNLLDNCAMYRKTDWEKVGGYCNEIMGNEDWDFWISMLKNGGEMYRLPIVGLRYRVRPDSLRKRTRHLKPELIAKLNERHKVFLYKQLGGPLYISRTWSETYNKLKSYFISETIISEIGYEELVYHVPELFKNEKLNSENQPFKWNNEEFIVAHTTDKNLLNKNLSDNKEALIGYYKIESILGKCSIFIILRKN